MDIFLISPWVSQCPTYFIWKPPPIWSYELCIPAVRRPALWRIQLCTTNIKWFAQLSSSFSCIRITINQVQNSEAISCIIPLHFISQLYLTYTRKVLIHKTMSFGLLNASVLGINIQPVWSGSPQSTFFSPVKHSITGYYKMFKCTANACMRLCACARWCNSA